MTRGSSSGDAQQTADVPHAVASIPEGARRMA
jgi:hypothetical protein